MSLEARKISLIQFILSLQKEDILQQMEALSNSQMQNIELSQSQKEQLDKRREKATENDFISVEQSNELLNKKYGL